jgi:outer membrane protein assembly factor BamB
VVNGDTICVAGRGAYKLSTKDGEVTVTTLWGSEGREAEGGRGGGGGRERRLPSPVVHDGLLYGVNTNGILDVVDVKSGETVYRQRLPVGQTYSSITLAGGLLYVLDLEGKAVVFKPGKRFERVAVNQLEGTGSCPVFADDHLYVRGRQNLYCLSTHKTEAKAKEGD